MRLALLVYFHDINLVLYMNNHLLDLLASPGLTNIKAFPCTGLQAEISGQGINAIARIDDDLDSTYLSFNGNYTIIWEKR